LMVIGIRKIMAVTSSIFTRNWVIGFNLTVIF
jgi:hypothetical protein